MWSASLDFARSWQMVSNVPNAEKPNSDARLFVNGENL
jgi:hypothetical protein